MGLSIHLKAGERVAVNGTVIRNSGKSRTIITIENRATILREKDFMRPEDITTPARELYYVCMTAYLDEADRFKHKLKFAELMVPYMNALRNPLAIQALRDAADHLTHGRYHQALTEIRTIISYEDTILNGDAVQTDPVAA